MLVFQRLNIPFLMIFTGLALFSNCSNRGSEFEGADDLRIVHDDGDYWVLHSELGLKFSLPGATFRRDMLAERDMCSVHAKKGIVSHCYLLMNTYPESMLQFQIYQDEPSDPADFINKIHSRSLKKLPSKSVKIIASKLATDDVEFPESKIWAYDRARDTHMYVRHFVHKGPESKRLYAISVNLGSKSAKMLPAPKVKSSKRPPSRP